MDGSGPISYVGDSDGGGRARPERKASPPHVPATRRSATTPTAPGSSHAPHTRPRAAVSPTAAVCGALALLLLVDLSWALASSGHAPTATPVLSLPPLLEALLLGAATAAWAVSAVRTRNALLRAETARVRAEADARRLLQVIDNTSSVIYIRDCDGRYLLVNRTFEKLFGRRHQDITGKTDHDLFTPEFADSFRANDLEALARGTAIESEEVAPQADGLHTYLTIKYPIDDATGRHSAVCGISTDITVLKDAEQEVRRLNADLEERVRERTAELEASTRELDAFAYSVSHDLRAPLRAAAGFSELLLQEHESALDDGGRDYLRRVVAATARMSQLIDNLLKLSRATRAELSWRPVDLSTLAHRILADLEAADVDSDSDPGRRVELVVDDALQATGDPALLELVLQNLISNAWKFTAKQDKPFIHVGAEYPPEQEHADGRDRVYFVRDNGVGFDMRYVDKLFVPFQRLHSLEDFAGSGIGLAIVNRVISRHGGRVWAEGRPGEGAIFRFVLPDRRPDADPETEAGP